MMLANAMLVVSVFLALLTTARAEDSATERVEQKYYQILDGWVKQGGPIEALQDTVVKTCGKLVIVTVDNVEKARMATTQREEFHHRVDVCTKLTVNRVYPQPEFEKPQILKNICDDSKTVLFKKLCRRYGLR